MALERFMRNQISLPKDYGGLNIRDTRKFHLALLAKLGWYLIN